MKRNSGVVVTLLFSLMSLQSFAQLTGIHTVGAGREYSNISEAIDDVYRVGVGRDGVVFAIEDGIYPEDLVFNGPISGADSLNPVVFVASNKEKPNVIVTKYPEFISNYLVKLDGVEGVIFENIIFSNSENKAGNSLIFSITNSGNIKIISCTLFGNQNTTNFENENLVNINTSSTGGHGDKSSKSVSRSETGSWNITFDSNYFNDGYEAINVSDNLETFSIDGLNIINNVFKGHDLDALHLSFTSNVKVENNVFDQNGIDGYNAAIFITNSTGKFLISKNKISGGYDMGIYVSNSNNRDNLIVNNFVNIFGEGGNCSGIELNSCTVSVYYNTVLDQSVELDGIGVALLMHNLSDSFVYNNILLSKNYYAVSDEGTSKNTEVDYNNVRSEKGNPILFSGENYFNLKGIQEERNIYLNSKEKLISFIDETIGDLHLKAPSDKDTELIGYDMKGAVVDDIDDDPRMEKDSFIGADEGSKDLPVEMISFHATHFGANAKLIWLTATETNNYGWEIEKKSQVDNENKDWVKIGFVVGKGTTTEKQIYSYLDSKVDGKTYYRLKQLDINGNFEYSNVESFEILPESFELLGNYPNPFNPSTMISFNLPSDSKVRIVISNLLGQIVSEIPEAEFKAGKNEIVFKAKDLSSGVYVYSVISNGTSFSKTMMLMK